MDLCGDKGICLPDYSKDSFTCKCDKGYTGTRCGKLQTSHPLGLFHLGGLKTKDSNHLCIKCDLKLFIYLLASYYSEVVFYSFLWERKAFSWSKECSAIIKLGMVGYEELCRSRIQNNSKLRNKLKHAYLRRCYVYIDNASLSGSLGDKGCSGLQIFSK